MNPVALHLPHRGTVLLLGAHSDDIEIGAGGTVLDLTCHRPDLQLRWIVFSGDATRAAEARHSASEFGKVASSLAIETLAYRDGFFPAQTAALKETFERLAAQAPPDLVLTHRLEDRHQDHRLIADLTWNTFRSSQILEYEIPKYDGDLGQPNLFVGFDGVTLERKVDLLMSCFASQRGKHWFTTDTFRGLARIRGIESGCEFAEGFTARKAVLRWSDGP